MDRIPIDDPGDPRIAHFVGLRDRELAHRVPKGGLGVFIAEGDVVAERAIRAGYRLRAVLVDATRADPLPFGVDPEVPVYAAAPPVLQSAETLAAADVRAGIPMRGGVDSLNVGVAAGIAFWVLGRRTLADGI